MKKLWFTAVAAMALVGPLAVSAASAQQGQGRQGRDQGQYQGPNSDDRADDRGDGRDQRDRRQNWRDGRGESRWDDARHNGYYENNHWYYGPPPAASYGRPGFSLGYQPWVRGQRLGYYSNRFQEVNYRQNNLRRPGRGSHWVRDDRGDFLLVAIRSGIIQLVIVNDRDRRDRREEWRDTRRDAHWDNGRHNGYYRNNQWHYGPPASGARGVAYGYRPWAAGQRLGYYNGRYDEVDYRQHRLRQPPRGYHWVRDDGGDFLLAAIVGGLIAEIVLNNNNR